MSATINTCFVFTVNCCNVPQVRVEAGCRVQQVADELKQYGLSLQNYASIREQQIGGFTQVGALLCKAPLMCSASVLLHG
jgi:hypothetical protein